MSVTNYYKIRIVSASQSITSQIYSILESSELDDDENTSDQQHELFDCCEELRFLSLTKINKSEMVVEYESMNSWEPHEEFVTALKRFKKTAVVELKSDSI